jgi:hypothetical protein
MPCWSCRHSKGRKSSDLGTGTGGGHPTLDTCERIRTNHFLEAHEEFPEELGVLEWQDLAASGATGKHEFYLYVYDPTEDKIQQYIVMSEVSGTFTPNGKLYHRDNAGDPWTISTVDKHATDVQQVTVNCDTGFQPGEAWPRPWVKRVWPDAYFGNPQDFDPDPFGGEAYAVDPNGYHYTLDSAIAVDPAHGTWTGQSTGAVAQHISVSGTDLVVGPITYGPHGTRFWINETIVFTGDVAMQRQIVGIGFGGTYYEWGPIDEAAI